MNKASRLPDYLGHIPSDPPVSCVFPPHPLQRRC